MHDRRQSGNDQNSNRARHALNRNRPQGGGKDRSDHDDSSQDPNFSGHEYGGAGAHDMGGPGKAEPPADAPRKERPNADHLGKDGPPGDGTGDDKSTDDRGLP